MLIPGGISEFIGQDGIRGLEDAAYVNPRYDSVAKDAGTLKKMVCRSFAVSEMKERLKSLIDETGRLFDVLDGDGDFLFMGPFDTEPIMRHHRGLK